METASTQADGYLSSNLAQSGGSRRLRKRTGNARRRKVGSTTAGGCWFGKKKTLKRKSRKNRKSRKSRK